MCKYISLGKIHSYYKYILFYLISHFLDKHLFHKKLVSKIGEYTNSLLSTHKLIKHILFYALMFFVSIFLICYEEYQKKKKYSNNTLKKTRSKRFKLIYKDQLKGQVSIIKILLIIFLLVIETELQIHFMQLGLMDLIIGCLNYYLYIIFLLVC